MKSIQFCLMFIVSVLCSQSFAQNNQFNLSDYKLPELKRHALVTSLDLSGNNFLYKIPSTPGNANKFNSNSYNSNFSTYYQSYLNSLTKQMEVNISVRLNSYYNNQKEEKKLKYEYSLYTTKNI